MSQTDVKQVQQKIAEIQRALSAMQYLSSGTLLKRMKLCGKPQCQCARNPRARHGPYYEWTYLKAGRLQHRTLTPAQAELMRLAIANYRKAKKLLRAWEAHTQHLIDLNAPAH
jgi:dsRNA-specific ribonuclease